MVSVSSSRSPQATTARCITSAGRRRLPAGRAALLNTRINRKNTTIFIIILKYEPEVWIWQQEPTHPGSCSQEQRVLHRWSHPYGMLMQLVLLTGSYLLNQNPQLLPVTIRNAAQTSRRGCLGHMCLTVKLRHAAKAGNGRKFEENCGRSSFWEFDEMPSEILLARRPFI